MGLHQPEVELEVMDFIELVVAALTAAKQPQQAS